MIEESTGESDVNDDALGEMMGYDKWPQDVAMDFERARGVASLEYIKNLKGDFAPVVKMFRALEAEFVVRVGDNEENMQQVRRIITEMLLQASWDMDQPFETCLKYWRDLELVGFYCIERRCLNAGAFAVCCQHYGHTDMGLALLDPLIAELQRLRAEPIATKREVEYYEKEMASLRKLRARLEAERG